MHRKRVETLKAQIRAHFEKRAVTDIGAESDADWKAYDSHAAWLHQQLDKHERRPLRRKLEKWGFELPPEDGDFERHARRAIDKEWRVRVEWWSRNIIFDHRADRCDLRGYQEIAGAWTVAPGAQPTTYAPRSRLSGGRRPWPSDSQRRAVQYGLALFPLARFRPALDRIPRHGAAAEWPCASPARETSSWTPSDAVALVARKRPAATGANRRLEPR